ncbi:MAG TPA: vWA domain-containing protein [Thermoanaerobaculia bacterium]|jgi:Mg-chelatase subunit ChlD
MRGSGAARALLALALLLSGSRAARAEAGLDLVVLVDRSTSMTHHRELLPLILTMTTSLIARNAAANRVEHRIAVISFGAGTRVDLPFAACRLEALPALRARIAEIPRDDLGGTDVLAAFRGAKQLFDGLPPDPERRRAAFVLTDGVPYVRGVDMTAYRQNLERFASAFTRTERLPMHALLLDARDASLWRSFASTVHTTRGATNEVLARAHGAVTALLGTRTIEATRGNDRAVDVLVVAPYLEMIVLDVFRGSADAAVEVFPPSSRTPLREGIDGVETVRVGDALATYVVPRPSPGQWRIRKSRDDSRVRIVSQQFFPRGLLVRPSAGDTQRQHDRVDLAYRLLDSGGQPLRALPRYALSVDVALDTPAGASTPMAMRAAPDLGPALFRGTTAIECSLAGRYWTDVKVTTVDASGQRLEIFRDRWSGFSVEPVQRRLQLAANDRADRSSYDVYFLLLTLLLLLLERRRRRMR